MSATVTIRSMMASAKSWGCAATIYVNHKLYKVWANGHVRIDGVHWSIDAAQQRMESGRIIEREKLRASTLKRMALE